MIPSTLFVPFWTSLVPPVSATNPTVSVVDLNDQWQSGIVIMTFGGIGRRSGSLPGMADMVAGVDLVVRSHCLFDLHSPTWRRWVSGFATVRLLALAKARVFLQGPSSYPDGSF